MISTSPIVSRSLHPHFRSRMQAALKDKKGKQAAQKLTLDKPAAISGKPAWFEKYYVANSQRERERLLFSR